MPNWMRRSGQAFSFLTAAVLVVFVLPVAVTAHAELVTSSPADGDTVVGNPPMIHATYSETLDPDGSSLGLLDLSGARVARGGVDAGAGATAEMFIRDLPTLAPGVYTVRSTTRSAQDGDIDRATWSFTVTAPPATATPEPTPICTDGCNGQSTDEPSSTPTAVSSATATATPSPSPAPAPPAAGSGDTLLPIIAALAIVAIGGALLVSRGRRPPLSG